MKSYLHIIFCIFFLIQVSYAGDPVYKSPIYKSPNAKNEIYCEAFFGGAASKWSITFLQNSNNLFGITIPAEKDVREIKVSWSPSSDAAILGLNSKAGEDWILVRFTNGNVVFSYIDGDKSVNAKLLNALPFHNSLKSLAPVGGVPWESVKWITPQKCQMTYHFRGIGYDGSANLLLNFASDGPTLKIQSIVSTKVKD